jgi:hypothetical protein
MKRLNAYLLFLIISLQLTNDLYAQIDTLPDFSLTNVNGSIQIQWLNPYKNIIQLNIQRSKESNKNFITIHSSPNPSVRFYKYTDKTAPTDSCYYRIFMLYEGSNYQFSKVKRPVKTEKTPAYIPVSGKEIQETAPEALRKPEIISNISTPKKDSENLSVNSKANNENTAGQPVSGISKPQHHHSKRDVILEVQHNINSSLKPGEIILRSEIKPAPVINTKKTWIPSDFVFTGEDGNVIILLPEVNKRQYSITFLKEEGRPLFQLSKIEQSPYSLDKVSFLKSGWYYFELRESGKVLERNKFLITRDN